MQKTQNKQNNKTIYMSAQKCFDVFFFFLLFPFFWQSCLVLFLCLWAVHPLIPGQPGSVRQGLPLMAWGWSWTSHWLTTPTSSVPLSSQHILHAGKIIGWSLCGCDYVPIPLLWALLVIQDSMSWLCILYYWEISLGLLINSSKFPPHYVPTLHPQISPSSVFPSNLFLHLHSWFHLFPSYPAPSSPTKSVLFPFPNEIYSLPSQSPAYCSASLSLWIVKLAFNS